MVALSFQSLTVAALLGVVYYVGSGKNIFHEIITQDPNLDLDILDLDLDLDLDIWI